MPKNLEAFCPHCGNVCVYRATSTGRNMRCHHCGLLFTRPISPGSLSSGGSAALGAIGLLAAFLLYGGCLYLGGGLRPSSTTASTQILQPEDDKPKAATQKQKDDAAKYAKQIEQENEEKKRRDKQEARKKAEEKKSEERATAYLRYAKKLAGDGQNDKARERLQEIVRDLPKTEAAKEARQLLEQFTP